MPAPNAAVLAARARRAGADAARDTRLEWFGDEVLDKVAIPMRQRVALATEHLRSAVVRNISTSVVRTVGPRGGTVVERSKPGEFPRADTTLLMKTIGSEVREVENNSYEGYVFTPLSYGLILEVVERLDRSYLVRTQREEEGFITRILTGPIA